MTPITNGTVVATGISGYIVSFNLSTELVYDVYQLIVDNNISGFSAPIVQQTADFNALALLLTVPSSTKIAYFQSGQVVNIYLDTTLYPYTGDTTIAFWYNKYATAVALVSDTCDVPDEAKQLFKDFCLNNMYELLKIQVPDEILNDMDEQKANLGLN